MPNQVFIEAKNLCKSFYIKDGMVPILKNINITINTGDFVIIFGPSGCGKSTLLHSLLGLEGPTSGTIEFEGKDFYGMTDDERAVYRRHRVGIIYQQPLWVSSLNVIENVSFSLHLLDYHPAMIEEKAMQVLSSVGMEKWRNYRPVELSSGQQQKISLARSMIIDPVLIVADEPTGNLDTVSGQELIETFMKLNSQGRSIIMVTHDLEYLRYASKIIHMIDGEVVEVYAPKNRGKIDIKGKRGTGEASGTGEANVRDREFLKKLNL
ncbi:MAG: hypothetical protein RI947_1111 [Candidatus Parcubacteria bacterium]|jgi:putative ABC transport system ATP-binding protein